MPKSLKEFLIEQLTPLTDYYSDTALESDVGDSVTLITSIHFNRTYVTVNKGDAIAGWTKKHDSKNDYSMSFKMTPISDTQISIEVYSRGIVATAMLHSKEFDGLSVWKFDNYNNTEDSFSISEYPHIQFTDSMNKQNQFTEFIAYFIDIIRKCLNDELHEYQDNTAYDSDSLDSNKDPEGDLVLTIRADTWNILRKKARILLNNGNTIEINKSMIGKKIVRKDSNTGVFFPLNEEDFAEYR